MAETPKNLSPAEVELWRLHEAATGKEWSVGKEKMWDGDIELALEIVKAGDSPLIRFIKEIDGNNARLIVAARNALPAILQSLSDARGRIAELEVEAKRLEGRCAMTSTELRDLDARIAVKHFHAISIAVPPPAKEFLALIADKIPGSGK